MANIKRTFPVNGLGCAACVARVEGALKSMPGVNGCSVSLASNTAQVDYDNDITSAVKLQQAVRDAGYDLLIESDSDLEAEDPDSKAEEEAELLRQKEYRIMRRDMVLAVILALAIFVIQMGFKDFNGRGIA